MIERERKGVNVKGLVGGVEGIEATTPFSVDISFSDAFPSLRGIPFPSLFLSNINTPSYQYPFLFLLLFLLQFE